MLQVLWLLPAFLLYTTAFGGTFVPKINLILSLICKKYCAERAMDDPSLHVFPVMAGGENPQCQIPEVQALVSKFSLYSSLIAGILSAITSPPLGALSDRYGRVRMQCAVTTGALFSELITIVVATCPDTFSVNWMLLGAFLDGLSGSFTAAMAITYAYTSDCTHPEGRNVAFGYIHGCLFFGIALGPLFAGYIIKATGHILTIFYIAIGAHGTFILWLLLVVPESLTKERQQLAQKNAANEKIRRNSDTGVAVFQGFKSSFSRFALTPLLQVTKLFAPLSILWPTEPGTNPALRRNLICLAAVDTTMFGVAMGSMTIVLIYAEYAFGWGNFETSIYVSITNTSRVAVLVILLPLVTRLILGPASKRKKQASGCDSLDLGIIRLSVIFDLLGYVGFAIFRTGTLFTLSGVLASIGGMGSPTLSAAITKHVPPDRTGKVLGAMGFLHAAARVVAPTIFNLIYAKTVGKFTPTVFICLAATFLIAFVFSVFLRPNGKIFPSARTLMKAR